MIDINHSMCRFRRVPRPAVALLAGALLLGATPAGAGWLDRGAGVAGAGKSLKETLAENTGIFGEMVGAFIDGDDEKVSELAGEVAKTPGKLIQRAFPVLEAPQAVAEKLKSAKRKIERFVGGAGETLADARAALAVDRDRQGGGWSDAALLAGEPLPAPPETAFTAPKYRYESQAGALAALKGEVSRKPGAAGDKPAASSWDFDEWVVAKQEARPHCYGVVDPETLPADCFGAATAEEPAAPPAVSQVRDSSSGDSGDEYAAALAGVLGDGSATSADDDYLAALSDLETKEAERLQLEEEERQRQARLEEDRQRQARLEEEERRERARRAEERRREEDRQLAEQQRLDALEYQRQREYTQQAIRNVTESLRSYSDQVYRAYGGGGTTAGGGGTTGGRTDTCEFSYCLNGRGPDCGRPKKCWRPDGTIYWK